MYLDQSSFPLVFLSADIPSDMPHELQFEAVLDRAAPFVLIGDHLPDQDHDEPHEERRKRALFFKKNKDRLRSLCRGIVVVEGDKAIPMPLRLAAQAVGKAFGGSLLFVRDEAGAVEAGMALLAGKPSSGTSA